MMSFRPASQTSVDVAEQLLGGEELHPVAGEPGDHVVRVLQVGGDVLLEGVVIDLVEADRDVLVRERVDGGVQPLLGQLVRVVRADRELAGGRAQLDLGAGQTAGQTEARAPRRRPLLSTGRGG